MEIKTIGDYKAEENQSKIRSQLFIALRKGPYSYMEAGKFIGVHYMTIYNFLNGKGAKFKTLSLISNWLEKQEGK